MPQRKIDVVFYMPGYDEFCTTIPVTRITPGQLAQLQQNIANAILPNDACPTSMSIKYEDSMSFLIGGMRCSEMTGRRRVLKISDLFWLSNGRLSCSQRHQKNTVAMMRRCAENLHAGRCRDEFMRNTIGAVLFPKLYGKDKQK